MFMDFNSGGNYYESYYTAQRPGKLHMRAFGLMEGEMWIEYHDTDDKLSNRKTTQVRRWINDDNRAHGIDWDPCIVDHFLFLKGPITGDVTLYLTGNPHCGLEWNKDISLVSVGGVEESTTLAMEADEYYFVDIIWRFAGGLSNIKLQWSYTGEETPINIPSTNFGMVSTTFSGYRTKEVGWPEGKTEQTIDGITYWLISCGDGVVDHTEQWDDSNTDDGDGCSATWKIEEGSYWTGGSLTTPSTWVNCHATGKSASGNSCVEAWGDKVLGPTEQCDDGNDSNGKLSLWITYYSWKTNIFIYRRRM